MLATSNPNSRLIILSCSCSKYFRCILLTFSSTCIQHQSITQYTCHMHSFFTSFPNFCCKVATASSFFNSSRVSISLSGTYYISGYTRLSESRGHILQCFPTLLVTDVTLHWSERLQSQPNVLDYLPPSCQPL